jgi:2-amino-4-hydroxy-6-hydroxymethyldihydropteridine diphosphokinase
MTETPNPYIVDADTLTGEMRPIRRCVIALGSNVGDRQVKLQGAIDALRDTPGVYLTAVSSVYETEPVDAPEGSEKFLNAVVLADSTLSAHLLLDRALAIESAYGREHSPERNAPRTLDVDIILIGDRRADDDDLTLPHPRAHERAFVLVPWLEVDSEAEIPGQGAVRDLLDKAGQSGVDRLDDVSLEIG